MQNENKIKAEKFVVM